MNQNKKVDSSSAPPQDPKDKIEISSEGRDMATTELSPERLQQIQNKINSNFYSSNEVLGKVADKILSEINK
jgi:anti-sigma28 factor (negative regulator of flagellin synthesis)